jgi:hypothetical protein
MRIETILAEDNLYEVIRTFNSSYFIDKNNQINKKLLGLWVSHLGGNKVIQNNNQFSICQLIEEAKILNIDE